MTNENDLLANEGQEQKSLPSMLNVLTILTIIGSAFQIISSIYSYFTVCKSAEVLETQEMPEVGGMLGDMIDSAVMLLNKQCENRLVILVATLASALLCLLGALMMRKLKKQGFMVYIIGELVGPAAMTAILGSMAFGGMMSILGMIVPMVMIILYATQRKSLHA
jgi:hypothetical protein